MQLAGGASRQRQAGGQRQAGRQQVDVGRGCANNLPIVSCAQLESQEPVRFDAEKHTNRVLLLYSRATILVSRCLKTLYETL